MEIIRLQDVRRLNLQYWFIRIQYCNSVTVVLVQSTKEWELLDMQKRFLLKEKLQKPILTYGDGNSINGSKVLATSPENDTGELLHRELMQEKLCFSVALDTQLTKKFCKYDL